MFHVVFILLALVGATVHLALSSRSRSSRTAVGKTFLLYHRAADQPHGLERGTNRGRLWRSAIHRARITRIERLRRFMARLGSTSRREKEFGLPRRRSVFRFRLRFTLRDFCSPDSRRRYEGRDRFDGSL
jgi:hypothetical protein